MRTRLDSFSEEEQCSLINLGYVLADAKSLPGQVPKAKWPYPKCDLR